MKSFALALLLLGFVAMVVLLILPVRAANALRAQRRPHPAPLPGPLNLVAMLRAIRGVETGDNPHAIGPHGERSAYQFTAVTWHNYTGASFRIATSNPSSADLIAFRHAQFILRRLQSRGIEADPEFFAAAWRYGPEFALACARTDYARRAANLYLEYYADAQAAVEEVAKLNAEE